MFCELFGVQPADQPAKVSKCAKPKAAKPKVAKVAKPRASKSVKPMAVDQLGAPFEHVREASPEPADVTQLEYDHLEPDLEPPVNDEWMDEELSEEYMTDEELNYEATSMTEECDHVCGSIGSSPGFFERKTVKVGKQRPPGIAVTFEDDSWIV
jgi:hypothetical protein